MDEEVIVLIPTYFANSMFLACVNSVMQNVENAQVLTYRNDVGWLLACNKLMKETTTDVILLNDDTVVLTDIVKEMRHLAYTDSRIGIVGGKALNQSGEMIINYGIHLASDGNTAHKHFGQPRNSVAVESQKAVEGSCMFIKRSLIREIGYFDEGYGKGYREELDYCLTARAAGWKVISSPKAEYVHYVSQTNSRLNITNDTHSYFMSKWGQKLALGKV